jgi:hypothetical protein
VAGVLLPTADSAMHMTVLQSYAAVSPASDYTDRLVSTKTVTKSEAPLDHQEVLEKPKGPVFQWRFPFDNTVINGF